MAQKVYFEKKWSDEVGQRFRLSPLPSPIPPSFLLLKKEWRGFVGLAIEM